MGKYLDSSGLSHLWSKIKAFFVKGNGKVFIGTCDTAAATVAKVVTCPDFTSTDLIEGATIFVTFSVTNSGAVGSLTMNVNGTGAKAIKYINNAAIGNIPGVGYLAAGLTYQFIYDGTYWVVQMNYNTNSNDSTTGYGRHTYGTWKPTTNLGAYTLSFTKDETQIVPVTAVNKSTATTKALTTETFNPFEPIFYYSRDAQVTAGTAIGASYLWFGYERIDLRYSFNTGTTLTANKDVFIKCSLQSDGMAKLATGNPIVQDLPSTADGFIYICLGYAYDTYRVSITFTHNVYEFKNGGIQILTRDAATVNGHTVADDVPSDLNNKLATISSLDGDVDSLWEEVNNLGLELNDKVDKVSGKGLSTNDFTATLKSKLDGIATGAEVNQNAFSNVKVGSTTVAADAKTDTLELAAGSYVTLTPDATNDKITIGVNASNLVDTSIKSISVDGSSMETEEDGYVSLHYSVCSTAAGTAAKTVAAPNSGTFWLFTGSKIAVKFSNTNTAAVADLTLAVGNTAAKPIKYRGTNLPSVGTLAAKHIYEFVYDGTNWEILGDLDTNTKYTAASASPKMDGTAAVGTSSKYAREDHVHPHDTTRATVDDLEEVYNAIANHANGNMYGICTTPAATVAKVVSNTHYYLETGGIVVIKFTYAVPANATLNINSKGAKAIYHKGAAIKANVIHAGDTATFLYNGSYYHLLAVDRATVTDVDDDYESTETITFPNGTMMQIGAYQFNFGSANYVDFTCTLNTPMSGTGYKVFFSATASNSTQALAPVFELRSKTTFNFVVRAWKNLSSTTTMSLWCGWLAIGR